MEEYKQWLEQQIERCLNDKDLQREHWAFCKAYEKFTALHQPSVVGSLPLYAVNRVEVIDEDGRSYVNWHSKNSIHADLQDEGRTLKVFVSKRR